MRNNQLHGQASGICMVLGLRGDVAEIPQKVDVIVNPYEVIDDGDMVVAEITGIKKLTKLKHKGNWYYLNFSSTPMMV